MGFHEMIKRAKSIEELVENRRSFRELIKEESRQLVYPSMIVLFQFLEDLDFNYHLIKHEDENRNENDNKYQGILYKGYISKPDYLFTSHRHCDLKSVLLEIIMFEKFNISWNPKTGKWFPRAKVHIKEDGKELPSTL